jgi:hypothetical protein
VSHWKRFCPEVKCENREKGKRKKKKKKENRILLWGKKNFVLGFLY